MSRADRQRAYRLGRYAETICAWYLRLRGYRILARGYRASAGEIDIVARRGKVLVMIEVKARESITSAAEAVTRRQQDRIVMAASQFLARYPRLSGHAVRFDAMLVAPWRPPRHVVDAWRVKSSGVNR